MRRYGLSWPAMVASFSVARYALIAYFVTDSNLQMCAVAQYPQAMLSPQMGLAAATRLACTNHWSPVIGAPFVSMAHASSGHGASVPSGASKRTDTTRPADELAARTRSTSGGWYGVDLRGDHRRAQLRRHSTLLARRHPHQSARIFGDDTTPGSLTDAEELPSDVQATHPNKDHAVSTVVSILSRIAPPAGSRQSLPSTRRCSQIASSLAACPAPICSYSGDLSRGDRVIPVIGGQPVSAGRPLRSRL